MTDFLKAVKADLRNRRMLPFVAVVSVALIAAVGYAVLGGGSSTATPTASAPIAVPGAVGIAVVPSKPETALAETTNGIHEQQSGKARDPFKPLPGSEQSSESSTKTSAPASSSSSGSSSKSSSSSSSSSGSSGTETKSSSKPSTPAKPKTEYSVAALFGIIPAGTAPLTAQLTPYVKLKLMTALPSANQPLVVFRGVTAGGKSATFSLVGEAILHGNATCLPNASQCQAIDVQPGHYEQLEYLAPNGETIIYELRVVTITSSAATTASLAGELRGESKAGRELLRRAGLLQMPFLRPSTQAGVLVFAAHSPRSAGAHIALHHS